MNIKTLLGAMINKIKYKRIGLDGMVIIEKTMSVIMLLAVVMLGAVSLARGEVDPHIHALYETLPRDQFVQYFNSLRLSFNITQYDFQPYVGTLLPKDRDIGPRVSYDDTGDLPKKFDSRENWPQCSTIREIYNQGKCGSCWTFGSATAASDRTCIHKGLTVRLSEEDLDCLTGDVCSGGDYYAALQYWVSDGLVTQECKPYNITVLKESICDKKCVNGKNYEADKHKGSKVWLLSSDVNTIKTELFKNGPITAGMAVYEDFRDHYKSGVYVHKFGKLLGEHSVRVIGYGVENGVAYWLGANSWSTEWGENGYFKIMQNQKDIGFEQNLVACLP